MGMAMSKILIAAFGAMGWLLVVQTARAQPLSDDAARQRCAQAAESSFRLSGWKTENGSTYQSHYNRTLHACLIEIEGRSQYGVTRTVSDAVEGRTYAIDMWVVNGDRAMMCQLIPSQKEKRDCANEEEYRAYAASLMERR